MGRTRSAGPSEHIDADAFDALCDDVAGHLNAQTGRLLDLTIWLVHADPRDWQGDGLWTPQQYLAWRCGIGPTFASNLVAAAQRAHELPVAVDALRRGEISFDQLMPVVRNVPSWADDQVASLAKRLTVTQIRRLVTTTDWAIAPDSVGADGSGRGDGKDDNAPLTNCGDRDADGHGERPDRSTQDGGAGAAENRVVFGHGADGRWFLHASLDSDLGAVVETAIDEARDSVFGRRAHEAGDDATGDELASDVDGLVELAHRSLDCVSTPSRRSRFRVNLHLDLDGAVRTDRGHRLPTSIGQFVTCDGTFQPVFTRAARPVSVGREQRTIPDRTRRVVLDRDQHRCRVPGCSAGRGLDVHHIVHWSDGGPTDTSNLIVVCGRHHRMHHRGRLGITGDADDPATIQFTNARGHPIRSSGANPRPPRKPPPPIRGSYEHPLGERLESRWVTFVAPDAHCRSARGTDRAQSAAAVVPASLNGR